VELHPWPTLRYFEAVGSLMKEGRLRISPPGTLTAPGMPARGPEEVAEHVHDIEAMIQAEVCRLETDPVDVEVTEACCVAVRAALDFLQSELAPPACVFSDN